MAVQNTGSAGATIGNIVVNLQRQVNIGTASKPKWAWQTVSSDIADAAHGDEATTNLICSVASSESLGSFTENAASGKLELTDADNNTLWAITPEKVIPQGQTVNLLFSAVFNNTILDIKVDEQIRAEIIVSFGNSGSRSDKSSCSNVDISGDGIVDIDEAYVRSVPTRITVAIPALNNCNSAPTLKETGVTKTGDVSYGSADYQGYDAGIQITDTTTFAVTASGVDGGAAGGEICNGATLKGDGCGVSVVIGYNSITNPDGTTTLEPIYHEFPCCTGVDLSASTCVDIDGGGFKNNDFCAYTQGAYGGKGEPYQMLASTFTTVFGSNVEVGIPGSSGFSMTFTSADAIGGDEPSKQTPNALSNYLSAGGTPGVLTADLTNPTSSSSGVFGGQVLTLKINVAESGIPGGTPPGFGDLYYCNAGDSLNGMTVSQILAVMETALGGGVLPYGYSIKGDDKTLSLNDLANNLNANSFDNCVVGAFAATYLKKSSCQ